MMKKAAFPLARTVFAWGIALFLFFPLFWVGITAFKTEGQAIAGQLFFSPTLSSFAEVQERSNYLLFARNSLITSLGSTILGILIAVPAAYSMAFFPTKRTRDILLWMLSTKMMPAVGALMPVYVMAQTVGMLDSLTALVIVFTLSNLPIMVWMLFSAFKEVPKDILEAVRLDGATVWEEFRWVIMPLTMGGIASTGLLCLCCRGTRLSGP